MPVMDEFREEREALKNSSFKKKLKYFWDYYRWYVIGGIIAIIAIVYFTKDILTKKDTIFMGFILNASADPTVEQEFVDEFATKVGLDLETYEATIDSSLRFDLSTYDEYSMASLNRVVVSISAGDLDFLAADPAAFEHYASSDTFYDLSTLLSEAQSEKYTDYFYYVDLAEIRRKETIDNPDEYVAKEYDHRDPTTMEDPLLVGLYINNSQKISSIYTMKSEEVILGIPTTAKHYETAVQFIDYIFE